MFEELVFLRVRVLTVADADIVLELLVLHFRIDFGDTDLIFGKECIADTSGQHQRYQDRYKSFGSHVD